MVLLLSFRQITYPGMTMTVIDYQIANRMTFMLNFIHNENILLFPGYHPDSM
jgi:hypothetical protein